MNKSEYCDYCLVALYELVLCVIFLSDHTYLYTLFAWVKVNNNEKKLCFLANNLEKKVGCCYALLYRSLVKRWTPPA